MLAHLDSRNSDGMDAEGDAPGANDAASGVAAMIEIAHTLARMDLDSTVVLVATSGEEQGCTAKKQCGAGDRERVGCAGRAEQRHGG
ncbi:MAG: M20/M25/M40 family metallo-hydrolase [Phycisphaerales bacterium]